MWIWLSISMILVIACIIFGIYSFISSRTIQKSISNTRFKNNFQEFQFSGNTLPSLQEKDILNLKIKLKSIEENSALNSHQLNEVQKRIEILESSDNGLKINPETEWNDTDEDWEKLYYETRREKQSLEENLNNAQKSLQENLIKLQNLEEEKTHWISIKSDTEFKTNEITLLQNMIDDLQRKLEGSRERENEMEQQVYYEKSKYLEFEILQKRNNQLKSELDILTNRLTEVNDENILMQQKIKNLTELGSILEISEYEKMGIKNSVEQLLQKFS